MKKKLKFKHILCIYAGVLAIATIVICCIVWSGLKKYQNSYDKAEASGNPELFMSNFIENWNKETVSAYIEEYGLQNVSKYTTNEQACEYFMSFPGKISYTETEKSNNIRPIYDIYAGDRRIAAISLKTAGNNDEFGFHDWILNEIVFDTNSLECNDYEVIVPAGSTVVAGNITLTKEDITGVIKSDSPVALKAESFGAVLVQNEVYKIDNAEFEPVLTVTYPDGSVAQNVEPVDDVFDYSYKADTSFVDEMTTFVYDVCEAYTMNIYCKLSFAEVCKYIEYNSDAYKIVQEVQSAIIWGWQPDVVEITEKNAFDFVIYNDNLFSCKYYGKVYRADEEEVREETVNYDMLFRKTGDGWKLTYFVIE